MAWLGVPFGVALDVWARGRPKPLDLYYVYLFFGAPFAVLAGLLGYAAYSLCAHLGRVTRGGAVVTGATLGALAAVVLRTPIVALTAVVVGAAAGAVWWAALPEPTRLEFRRAAT
ncbi:MAG: hypothetical protein WKG32_03865 [Gemmatimonadaceae bacterium]